jgi:RNA polymerase sigma-70 factor, ECF subfamily
LRHYRCFPTDKKASISSNRNMTADFPTRSVTQLLQAWRSGEQAALDQLLPIVQGELHSLAQRMMSRETPGHTWQTTELVHEAYLRLAGQHDTVWQDRAHFFAVAAQVMRHLLVDHARAKQMDKRGGDLQRVSLDENAVVALERSAELLALDEALDRLAEFDTQKSRIVELRYFGGLTVPEVAEVMGIAAITVKREWARAKLWLQREMQTGAA